MLEYNKKHIPFARKLRKEMTKQERKLWYEFLRNYPIRFQRQKSIGNYIVDFYCAKARLVIEIDGGGHYFPMRILKDGQRSEYLSSLNLVVIRICNCEIDGNFDGVCLFIDNYIKNLSLSR